MFSVETIRIRIRKRCCKAFSLFDARNSGERRRSGSAQTATISLQEELRPLVGRRRGNRGGKQSIPGGLTSGKIHIPEPHGGSGKERGKLPGAAAIECLAPDGIPPLPPWVSRYAETRLKRVYAELKRAGERGACNPEFQPQMRERIGTPKSGGRLFSVSVRYDNGWGLRRPFKQWQPAHTLCAFCWGHIRGQKLKGEYRQRRPDIVPHGAQPSRIPAEQCPTVYFRFGKKCGLRAQPARSGQDRPGQAAQSLGKHGHPGEKGMRVNTHPRRLFDRQPAMVASQKSQPLRGRTEDTGRERKELRAHAKKISMPRAAWR